MNLEQFWREVDIIIDEKIEKKLRLKQHFIDYGEVVSVSSNLANVKINGAAEETKDVPFRSDLTLTAGDKVTILNLNFNKNDRLIIDKR